MFYDGPDDPENDDEMKAKKSAIQAMSDHIGASGDTQDEKDNGSDANGDEEGSVDDAYNPDEGAIPRMKLRKKSKKGGGGGGMGGMMGGGGGGGMDMSSMMGSMGGAM